MEMYICVCGQEFHSQEWLAHNQDACAKAQEARDGRAEERKANPLKLLISGAERQVSEGIRVGAGRGEEYFLAAHRALTAALKMIDGKAS